MAPFYSGIDKQIVTDPVTTLPLWQKLKLINRAAARAKDNKTRILTQLSIVEFLIEKKQNDLAREYLDGTEKEMLSHSPIIGQGSA